MAERGGQGLKTADKGTIIPKEGRIPSDPNLLHMSKKDVIAQQNKKKEKASAMAQHSLEYDEGEAGSENKEAPATPEKKKACAVMKKGRNSAVKVCKDRSEAEVYIAEQPKEKRNELSIIAR